MTNGSKASRYDNEIDMGIETSHTKILRLVGTRQRVLDLGCATGQLAKVLRERGCEVVGIEADAEAAKLAAEHCDSVIVGDVEELDLAMELGERRFDVIVAGDVLEHLKAPEATLASLRPFLDRNGCLITSVPNVAHGSVRLALLTGSFPYAELGLLDRTHLRFYTRSSLREMLEAAEFTPVHVEDLHLDIEHSEVPFAADEIPPGLVEVLAEQTDARVYQFVVVALPSRAALGPIPQITRALHKRVEALEPLETEVELLRTVVAQQQEAVEVHQLRLLEANDRALRNDGELERLRQLAAACAQQDSRVANLEYEVAQLRDVEDQLRKVYASRVWRAFTTYRGLVNVLRSARPGPS